MVLVDAIARRLPGALAEGSGELESFSEELGGGLEYPHYTRPAEFRGWTRARHPALRRPREDRSLAAGAACELEGPARPSLPRACRAAGASSIDWLVTIVGAILIVLAIKAWVVNPYRIPSSLDGADAALRAARRRLRGALLATACSRTASSTTSATRSAARSSSSRRRREAEVRCGAGGTFVKRLIGLPGETVSGARRLRLHQRQAARRAVHQARPPRQRARGTRPKMPPGHYFFMGDNRAQSCDSREWGTVPRENLIGKVFVDLLAAEADRCARFAAKPRRLRRPAASLRIAASGPPGHPLYEQRSSKDSSAPAAQGAPVQGGGHRSRPLPGDRGPAPP